MYARDLKSLRLPFPEGLSQNLPSTGGLASVTPCASVESLLLSGNETGPEGSLWEDAREAGVRSDRVDSLVRAIDPAKDWSAYRDLRRRFSPAAPSSPPPFHVVHTHSSKAGVLGRRAAARSNVPAVIHTVHGWPFHLGQSWALRKGYLAVERQAAAWADKLVCVSEDDIEAGLRLGIGSPEQYALIRSGIDLSRFANPSRTSRDVRRDLGIPESALVLGAITRLSPQKAPLDLVRLFSAVHERVPESWFLLVGDGPLQGEVRSEMERLGIASRVVCLSVRRDVPELLSALDLFAMTSRWEGLPRTIPEAMSAGVPVVALEVTGIRDLVKDGQTGLLRRPGDLAGLAQATAELLRNPTARAEMAEAGRRKAESFGGERMIEQLGDVYTRILLQKGWLTKLDTVSINL